jgi:hypothetical protein
MYRDDLKYTEDQNGHAVEKMIKAKAKWQQ